MLSSKSMESTPPILPPVNIETRAVSTIKASKKPAIRRKIGWYVTNDALVEEAIHPTIPAAPTSILSGYFIKYESDRKHENEGAKYADYGFPTNRVNPGTNYRVHHTLFFMNAYRLRITYPTKKLPITATSGKKIKFEKVIHRRVFPRRHRHSLDIFSSFLLGRGRQVAFELIATAPKRTKRKILRLRRQYKWAESLYQWSSQFAAKYLLITPSSKKRFEAWYSRQ